MDLALFDFDGTITTRGTYPGFVRFAVRPQRKVVGGIILSPLIVGYRTSLVSDRVIRKAMSRIGFRGEDSARLRIMGERYAEDVLPSLIRPVALERMTWHRARGDRVVVVSASLDVYLEPWCSTFGVDVICTQLEVTDGAGGHSGHSSRRRWNLERTTEAHRHRARSGHCLPPWLRASVFVIRPARLSSPCPCAARRPGRSLRRSPSSTCGAAGSGAGWSGRPLPR
jgi:phosphatidylglycerophosphatase C